MMEGVGEGSLGLRDQALGLISDAQTTADKKDKEVLLRQVSEDDDCWGQDDDDDQIIFPHLGTRAMLES